MQREKLPLHGPECSIIYKIYCQCQPRASMCLFGRSPDSPPPSQHLVPSASGFPKSQILTLAEAIARFHHRLERRPFVGVMAAATRDTRQGCEPSTGPDCSPKGSKGLGEEQSLGDKGISGSHGLGRTGAARRRDLCDPSQVWLHSSSPVGAGVHSIYHTGGYPRTPQTAHPSRWCLRRKNLRR